MAIVFEKKYYKYNYGTWTQPVLTSNTSSTLLTLSDPSLSGSTIDNPTTPTWGTNKVTNFSTLFNCMDSSTTNYFTINSGNRTYTVFDIEFSNKLKISQIYIAGNVVAGYASSMTGSIIYDMSSGNPVLLSSKTDGNYNTHTFSKVVKKIRVCIRPNNDGTSYPSRITAFTITAQQVTGSTESTASDYDYIKDIKVKDIGEHGVYLGSQNTNCLTYTPKNVNLERTYGTWTQPTLTANGTVGGDNYAVRTNTTYSGYDAYKAFDNSNTTFWAEANVTNSGYIEFYSPIELKVSKITIQNRHESVNTWATGVVYGSLNGTNYFEMASFTNTNATASATWDINITNSQPAKYVKISTKSLLNSSHTLSVAQITFTATALKNLTLKAGSKVYVPNGKNADGSNKFDEVVIGSDIVNTTIGANECLICVSGTHLYAGFTTGGTVSERPSSPITHALYYNTSTNKCEVYYNSTWNEFSLPVAKVTRGASGFISIDQIFDWCGHIGSTLFTLPGIKGLIPNSWNSDGTYKVIEFETNKVTTKTAGWYTDYIMFIDRYSYCAAVRKNGHYFEQDTMPHEPSSLYDVWYNPKENVYRIDRNSTSWERYEVVKVGEFGSGNNNSVTSLTPYTAQPETTAIPIDAIYYGSQLVYQYHPYEPNTLVFESNTATTKTISLHKGVYEVTLVGGGGGGGAVWVNGSDGGGGGSGACVRSNIRLKTGTYTFVCGGAGAGGTVANSGVDGDAGGNSTLSLNGSTLITAGGGGGGLCGNVNGGLGGAAGTYNIASGVEVVKTIINSNGNAGGTGTKVTVGVGGASVAGLADYPDAGRGAGSRSNGYNGFIRLRYIGA